MPKIHLISYANNTSLLFDFDSDLHMSREIWDGRTIVCIVFKLSSKLRLSVEY